MADLRIERVVVTGGRKFTDGARIEADLRALLPLGLQRVAQGGARGADGLARATACRLHDESGAIEVAVYFADWEAYGHRAGPLRNIQMLEAERPDLVLAYPDPDSRGTWHCVREALKRGVPVVLWGSGAKDGPHVVRLSRMRDVSISLPNGTKTRHWVFASSAGSAMGIREVLRG